MEEKKKAMVMVDLLTSVFLSYHISWDLEISPGLFSISLSHILYNLPVVHLWHYLQIY